MSKKVSKIIGLVVSVVLIIVGITSMSGGLTGDSYYGDTSPYLYDYGYATFGADFYTFVSNNAALAAYNASNLITLMENVFGWAFIAAGMFGICKFGKKDEDTVKNNTIESPTENPEDKTESIAEVPAEESVNEENSCGE